MLYNLLIKDVLPKKSSTSVEKTSDLDNRIIEISNSFTEDNNLYVSYLLQTITKLLLTFAMLAWLIFRAAKIATKASYQGSVMCQVYEYWYECSGHPQKLYFGCAIVASAFLVLHIALNIINLVWLNFPNIGNMSSVMELYVKIDYTN